MGKVEGISIGVIGLVLTGVIYAMDWQREQDEKLATLDKLIEKQRTLLEMQVKINEAKYAPVAAYGYAPFIEPVMNNTTAAPPPSTGDM
jgi:hypothetical protein